MKRIRNKVQESRATNASREDDAFAETTNSEAKLRTDMKTTVGV
jgi:hypothetical protein